MWHDQDGEFVRGVTKFRDWIRADGSTPFAPEKGRYHLYISLACPWASRTNAIRKLRKLEDVVSMSIVSPVWNQAGWCFDPFPGVIPDDVNHVHDLVDLYRKVDPDFSDQETVPVLWDKKRSTIVNNESAEIMRMFDVELRDFGDRSVNLYPSGLEKKIDDTIRELYQPVNNGVYRAGFAGSQRAYERAVRELFAALDHWEHVLSGQRFLCGNVLTEADICFFTTLVRFDAVYHGHFKCNLRRIADYPNLFNYLKDLYQTDGIAETVDFDHIKNHYYRSQVEINPSGIVPLGPIQDLRAPHDRARVGRAVA